MRDVCGLVIPNAVAIWLGFLLVGIDERRMSATMRARMWLPATKLSALVLFSPISLIVHFTKTRRTILGFAMGLCAAIFVAALSSICGALVDAAFDCHFDPT